MLSKWMGHASLEVTAIYANALGEEQRHIAARMWE
jgi:integrase